MDARVNAAATTAPTDYLLHLADNAVVLDIPLLAESGWEGIVGTIVVDLDPELAVQRLVEHRVPVAVDRGPPRGHAVDHLAAVRQPEQGPLGAHHQPVSIDSCNAGNPSQRLMWFLSESSMRLAVSPAETAPTAKPTRLLFSITGAPESALS